MDNDKTAVLLMRENPANPIDPYRMIELRGLANAAGYRVLQEIKQRRERDHRVQIGRGKIEEALFCHRKKLIFYNPLSPTQVFGLGTHLDSMRLKSQIASHFKVHVSEVHTRIIGEHGESMVPLWSATTIGGIKISNLPEFSYLPVQDIIESVRNSGQSIIQNKGSTVYGPGEAIATLVRTVLSDENRILTVSAFIKTEVNGVGGDVCIGVPARINRSGVSPIAIRIDESEVHAFRESEEKIRGYTRAVFDNLSKS